MALWRYEAVTIGGTPQRGELSGASPADVRASLRRIGLRVLEVRPARRPWAAPLASVWRPHLRRRRTGPKAEFFDALGTLLDSGLPLLESLRAITGDSPRSMPGALAESLRSGSSLADAMRAHPAWFDPAEVAMAEAGQRSGDLSRVLHALARRHERTGQLTAKLVSALAYPAIVACVGLGVVVFLGTRTLPQLVSILTQARVEPPPLTLALMAFGRSIAAHWPWVLVAIAGAAGSGLVLAAAGERERAPRLRTPVPRAFRRVAMAHLATGLAELTRTGIPVVEALRIVAPTIRGFGAASLRRAARAAADRVERGDDLADALDDPHWFNAEFRRLVGVGQASGELPDLLERLGDRYARSAHRSIDRLASLVEPAVILALAAVIGVVVMAAVLPMLKLQEVVR